MYQLIDRIFSPWTSLFSPYKRRSRRDYSRVEIESLETRILLTIDVVFDYTFDTNGFFTAPERRIALEAAGRLFEDAFSDTLSAITPSGGNTWTLSHNNPQTGADLNIVNPSFLENQVVIYVGARDLAGSTVGEASAGYSAGGNTAWFNTIDFRGQTISSTESSTYGGSIAFDSLNTWHFGLTETGLGALESDFYSTAIHEIAHLFGISSGNDAWTTQISGGTFNGPNIMAVNGGNGVPAAGGHFADNVMSDGREVAMSPVGTSGTRDTFTTFDWAAMDDIGWTLTFNEAASGSKPGHLIVSVTDPSGNPLAGQTVTLTGSGTANSPTGTTDANGLFSTFVTGGSWTATVNGVTDVVTVNGGMEVAEITYDSTPLTNDLIVYDAATGRWRAGINTGSSFNWIEGARWNPNAGWQTFTGDVNGDGFTDGIGFNSTNQIFFAINDGAGNLVTTPGGSFSSAVTFQHLMVGDFDGNGTDDFLAQQATVNGPGLAGQWFSRQWNGTSFETGFYGRWSPDFVEFTVTDANGDGSDDIVGLIDDPGATNKAYWYQGISNVIVGVGRRFSGQFSGSLGEKTATAGWHNLLAGDWNNDGRGDVAIQRASGGFFFATSNGTPITSPNLGASRYTLSNGAIFNPASFSDFVVGDFNGDNLDDIASRNFNNDEVSVALTSFVGTVSSTRAVWGQFTAGTDFFTSGDFDQDGKDDLAAIEITSRISAVSFSQTTSFAASQEYGTINGVSLLTGPLFGKKGALNAT